MPFHSWLNTSLNDRINLDTPAVGVSLWGKDQQRGINAKVLLFVHQRWESCLLNTCREKDQLTATQNEIGLHSHTPQIDLFKGEMIRENPMTARRWLELSYNREYSIMVKIGYREWSDRKRCAGEEWVVEWGQQVVIGESVNCMWSKMMPILARDRCLHC